MFIILLDFLPITKSQIVEIQDKQKKSQKKCLLVQVTARFNDQNQVLLNSYRIHWYLCFKYNLYLPDNLNENMQIISFVLKGELRRDHVGKTKRCLMLYAEFYFDSLQIVKT